MMTAMRMLEATLKMRIRRKTDQQLRQFLLYKLPFPMIMQISTPPLITIARMKDIKTLCKHEGWMIEIQY